jgi:hypothetical protein
VKVNRILSAALLAMTLALPASAQQQQQLRFTGAGNVTGFGYYVGRYQGQILSLPGQPTIDLYCVDFLHHIQLGQTWSAWMSELGGSLEYTRGGSGAYGLYLRAAWLTQQYAGASTAEWKNIQATIWNLFNSGPTPTTGNYWMNLANQNYTQVNPKYFYVLTPTNKQESGSAQEFITYVTPEPETYAMFASGLVVLGFLALRRRRAANAVPTA